MPIYAIVPVTSYVNKSNIIVMFSAFTLREDILHVFYKSVRIRLYVIEHILPRVC